jgi:hypothetical protein
MTQRGPWIRFGYAPSPHAKDSLSERNVSLDNIARIARVLKVKAWTLLDDSTK